MQELSYDAWGRLRNPSTFTLYTPTNEPEPYLGRGYCGHEHLTGLGLINMNARLYDPLLGRFLSPDPYVQAPNHSQSYNRYSYCLNNPLKYTDKSGQVFGIDDLIIIAGVVVGAYLGGAIANRNQWNPAKWNYSNIWTYVGIIGGGALGGYAGSAIAAGNLTLSVEAITPFGAIGVNNWKDKKNNNRRTEVEINTIAGGHWNYGEEKGIKNADKSVDDAVNSMRDYYNRITSNLSTNSSAIRYYGPKDLVPYATKLSNNSTIMYYSGQLLPITFNSINNRFISPNNQRKLFEMAGGYMGSWIGGRTMGCAMAGLCSETGIGAIAAGGYGYIVGSYMGYQIGCDLGDSLFDMWYDLYYNTYSSLKEIENYSNSIQNSYQPIW
jgi:RHS repeat-associated protein